MKSKLLQFLSLTLVLLGNTAFAQSKDISGVVYDESNMTLPGASVVVKGTSVGTTTDFDGNFEFNDVKVGDVIEVSFIGYVAQEITVGESSTYKVNLVPDSKALDEVIVVAYGTASKESFTGSATTVDVGKISISNTDNVTKSLEGLSSGVQITSGSGQPGEESTIRIRGVGSVNANSDPLIVVDGFPYGGNLNTIPSENIASMTVLKDAAAKSLYGSRAANGVIIITTKKGKSGESTINFKAVVGVSSRAIPEYDIMGVPQYYETYWSKLANETTPEIASQSLISKLGGYNAYNVPNDKVVGIDGKLNPNAQLLWNDDWNDESYNTGVRQEYDLSVSGGTDKTQYYVGANYLNSDGIVKASNFKRYSVRSNVSSQVKNWLKVSLGVNASTSDQNFPQSSGSSMTNVFAWNRNIAPIYPIYQYELDGTPILGKNGEKLYDYGSAAGRERLYGSNINPLGTIALDTRWNKTDVLSTRGSLEFTITPELKLQLNGSSDYYVRSVMTHQNKNFGDAASFDGRSTRKDYRNFTVNANEILTYTKTISDIHTFSALLGHEAYMKNTRQLQATRTGFGAPDYSELAAAAVNESSNSYEDNVRMDSYFGQIDYSYDSKYYVKATFRADGSSRFSSENRWGEFWSVSGSWRISQEDFLSDVSWIDNMKLKASYGTSGNDQVGLYAWDELWDFYPNNNYQGVKINRLETKDLSWEKTGEFNVGIDSRLFNKLTVGVEYYNKLSYDLLFDMPLSPSTGNSSIQRNIGALRNSGVEFELGYDIFNGDFKWNVGINGAINKNEFTELSQDGITKGSKRYEVGKSIYEFYIQDWAGVRESDGAPMWWKDERDSNGNKTGKRVKTDNYGSADRYFVGSSLPKIRGGISTRLEYANFDFTILTSYSYGGKVYDSPYAGLMDTDNPGNNFHKDMANAWTPTNTHTDIPVLQGSSRDFNSRSTRFLRDASYFSINNITLGYTLPNATLKRFGVSSVRFFVTGDNLGIISSFKGLDPRQSISGTIDNVYTPLRTVSAGLNLKF